MLFALGASQVCYKDRFVVMSLIFRYLSVLKNFKKPFVLVSKFAQFDNFE